MSDTESCQSSSSALTSSLSGRVLSGPDLSVIFCGSLQKPRRRLGFLPVRRWFELCETHLCEYNSRTSKKPKHYYDLEDCVVLQDATVEYGISMSGPFIPGGLILQAESEIEQHKWLQEIQQVVAALKDDSGDTPSLRGSRGRNSSRSPPPTLGSSQSSPLDLALRASASPTGFSVRSIPSSPVPSIGPPPPPIPPKFQVPGKSKLPDWAQLQDSTQLESLWRTTVESGDGEMVDLLAEGINVDSKTGDGGETALHIAVEMSNLGILQKLIQLSANMDARDNRNRSPLHLAADLGHFAVMEALLQTDVMINAPDSDLDTPLHLLCQYNDIRMIQKLLDAKANPDVRNSQFYTPLHVASKKGFASVVELLLINQARVDVCCKQGDTPLMVAKKEGHEECVCLLDKVSSDQSPLSPTTEPARPIQDQSFTSSFDEINTVHMDETVWQSGTYIGHGSYGEVRLCLDSHSGKLFAAKQLVIPEDGTPSQELVHLQALRNKHVVPYIGHHFEAPYLYICLQYVEGGSIQGIVEQYGCLSHSLLAKYTKQILMGLSYLHMHDVLHRDIKPANILVSKEGLVRLTDFGTAKRIFRDLPESANVLTTIPYSAPEIYTMNLFSYSSDVWSVGCTVLHMATGSFPWSQQVEHVAAAKGQIICKLRAGERPAIPADLHSEVRNFIEICLTIDHQVRPTCDGILSTHSLLQNNKVTPSDTSASNPNPALPHSYLTKAILNPAP